MMSRLAFRSAVDRRARRLAPRALLFLLLATLGAPPQTVEAQRAGKAAVRKPASRKPAARKAPRKATSRPTPPASNGVNARSSAALAADIGSTIGSATRSGTWGVMVVSLTHGDTIYALNAGEPMQPASTMKLMTTALAFERLGPDHQLRTLVLRDGPLTADGTVQGNLILRGTGDPAFSGRYLPGGPSAPVDVLAELVAGAGVRRVTGSIIGDATAFEARTIPAGWKDSYLHLSYAAPFSALSINENVVWITIEPGSRGGPAKVTWDPMTSGVPLVNSVSTRGGGGSAVSVIRRPSGGYEARGWIGAGSGQRRLQMVIDDPAPFTTGAFREALLRRGIPVGGGIVLGPTPDGAQAVAELPSPPIARMVAAMNRESINHYAEQLFRNAARGRAGRALGSAETGDAALREFLTSRVGVSSSAIIATDGSGLSLMDRVTPRAMTRLLAYANDAPWSSAFHASLPVAGESELLRNRMKFSPAQGNLHAKTGTTDTVIALAGYTTAEDGEIIAFTFLYNGRDRWNAKAAIDRIGETLSGFARAE